jgi:uncharacterized membrane protein YraQ (UPF0718 family)
MLQTSVAAVGRVYRPFVLSVAILTLLAILTPTQAGASALFTLTALGDILPFLLLSVATTAALKASGADALVAKAFEGRQAGAIVVASAFGALSPFCSCGVVPVVAGLLAAGVPIAPVMAFCIASPIVDPELFILTAAGLGLEFAVVKTLAAVSMGLLAGYGVLLASRAGLIDDALKGIARPSTGQPSCCGSQQPKASPVWTFWREEKRRSAFWRESGASAWFLARWLGFAFLLESLMVAYVPGEMIGAWLGTRNAMALPLAVVVGVPAYLNGYAAIPLIRGLIDLGMSPATGLAFMLAGSATSIPAAIAVWSLFKPRLFALYLSFAAAGSLAAGYAYLAWLSIA